MAIVISSTSQTPVTRSFGYLKGEVSRYVQAPDDDEAQRIAGDGINESIRQVNKMTWSWMLTYHDITTVADTNEYTVPATYKDSFHMDLLNSAGNVEADLDWLDPKTFAMRFPMRGSSGTPCAFTVFNSFDSPVVSLDKATDSAFVASYPTMRHRFYARAQLLVNDSDTFNGPSEIESWLQWNAKAYMAAAYDISKYQIAKQEALMIWRELRSDDMEQNFRNWSR